MGLFGAGRSGTAWLLILGLAACGGRSARESTGDGDGSTTGGTGTTSGGTGATSLGGTGAASGNAGGTGAMSGGGTGATVDGGGTTNQGGTTSQGGAAGQTTDDCATISDEYSAAIPAALACTTDTDCSRTVRTLGCSCPMSVSDPTRLDELFNEWASEGCAEKYPIKCPVCLPLGTAYCDATGMCANRDAVAATGGTGGGGASSTGGSGNSGTSDAGAAGEGVEACATATGNVVWTDANCTSCDCTAVPVTCTDYCGGEVCRELALDYVQALARARKCTVGTEDCTHLSHPPNSFCYSGLVADTTELDSIQAAWDADGCTMPPPTPCAAPPAAPQACGGDGLCPY
ncbi:MAG TPA: hypothetical protein VMI54_03625 [Polyangiaceae bacterium]|nr:hypothetical protein [Polyangiaceae bacterium]